MAEVANEYGIQVSETLHEPLPSFELFGRQLGDPRHVE
jgi:hypothetical protein